MRKSELVTALRRVPLFSDLTDRDLGIVAGQVREEYFNPGEDIVKQGGAGGPFYLIAEGRAKVLINGRARGAIGPGGSFGEIALLDQGPRSATIRAETHIKAMAISSWNFLALLQDSWKLNHKVMKGLCRRVRELDKLVT
jgi:CRP-like cAMP-binding protein